MFKQEQEGFAFEEIVAPATVDDGLDRYDPADGFCFSFASPSVGERDPNAVVFDQYAGCFER